MTDQETNRMKTRIDYHSNVVLFNECPRKYYYRKVCGLKETVGEEALWSIHLIHKPITEWYRCLGEYDPPWDKLWADYGAEQNFVSTLFYSLERAKVCFTEYVRIFADDFKEYFVQGVEEFSEEVNGYKAKPDVVLRSQTSDQLSIMDIKSSKYEKQLLSFDRQLVGQALAFHAEYMILTAVRLVDTKKKIEVEWSRDILPVDDEVIKDFNEERLFTARQIDKCFESDIWPKNAPQSCFRGRNVCDFIDLCSVPKKFLQDRVLPVKK